MALKCIKCGQDLIWGGFAYSQDMCWECFRQEILQMREQIDKYPSWLWYKRDEHKQILNWMASLVAEHYGEEF